MNYLEKIREKLRLYDKAIIEKDFLEKILAKFAPNYSITQISNLWLVSPLKRGKYYFNKLSLSFVDPYEVISYYMWDSLYCIGWLWVYNTYWFSTQVVEWHTVYNTKISWKKILWNTKIIFKRQRQDFFYGIDTRKTSSNCYHVMSVERAFIQRVKEGDYFTSIPKNVDKHTLLTLTQKYSSKTLQNKIQKLCLQAK